MRELFLLCVQNVRDVKAGVYCQETITGYLRKADTPAPFGKAEAHGWCGVSHYSHYLEELLTLLLQGTFGQALRSDHTRRGAGKVVLSSGTMSSYAIMNENWRILSWVTCFFCYQKPRGGFNSQPLKLKSRYFFCSSEMLSVDIVCTASL
ncbi:Carbon monoxide dehydrogenase [Dissostichus eleginoides]|uniref:Carbon monoxide dehydrogenase n=1 Tax=Dissostichus eleginoides TaxID=100907 RepID=A0AAD9BG99_DISEL|nr:Carbon monoxide dehydrogenase [Dissostichus eleginoides]